MALLLGQYIDADELEKVTSTWPPQRFATLCNTVAWAASGRVFQTFPSFTSRVNVKDGGVDAECTAEIQGDNTHVPTPILGPGWNVFQYKQRDVFARKRQSIISHLRSSLSEALKKVETAFGRKPDRYILFANIHFTPNETASIKKSIVAEYGEPSRTTIDVIGAAELAALLNDHPHLRAGFFSPLAFQTWEDAYQAHRSKKRFSFDADLVGRESELDRLRALIDNSAIRAIIVSGPHDMGKSRLALEATKHRPQNVAVALDPRSMSLADYRILCSATSEVICIVEDPEYDSIQSLIGEALSVPGLKLLITFPAVTNEQDLSYGFDDRVESMPLAPLNDESARKLIQAAGPIDYGIQDWIVNQAGGIPGIILAAASIAENLRQDHSDFGSAVGSEFERRIRLELGEAPLESARLLSALTYVGTTGPHESELQAICAIFGKHTDLHDVLSCLPTLERAGLARRAGYFVEISLPFLANHLAEQLFHGRRDEMFALFARLDEAGEIRFLKRIEQIKGSEAKHFGDEMFAPEGPLGIIESILKRPHLLRLIAGTMPDHAIRVLEDGIVNRSKDERLQISGKRRRELMWALEQLLFRTKTSKNALHVVWLLAEAENESWGNNATGVLQECFIPRHPQMPLPLDERVSVIKEFLSKSPAPETQLLAIKAIQGGLRARSSIRLRHGLGSEPLDVPSPLRPEDPFNYVRDLVQIMVSLAKQEGEVSQAALVALPECIAYLAFHGLIAESRNYFQLLTDWALLERKGLDVSNFSAVMLRARDFCTQQLAKSNLSAERGAEYKQFISDLAKWQASLDQAGFSIRLKQCVGGGRYRISVQWKVVEEHLRLLAKEAVQSPQILTPDLVQWLLAASANEAGSFFYALGQEDHTLHFQSVLEALAKSSHGSRAFAPYFAGWAKRDVAGAETRLDELADSRSVTTTALLETTSWLEPTPRGLRRIKQVAPEDPEYAAAILGRWINRLDLAEFSELLRIIAGEAFQRTSAAVDLLGSWIYHQKHFDDELSQFAWKCIELGPSKSPTRASAWHFDELAAKLTELDSDEGFKKFQHMLITWAPRALEWSPLDLEWSPLDMDGGTQWWETLRQGDRARLFLTLLEASRKDDTTQEILSWRLKDLIDQEQDAEDLLEAIDFETEHARIAAKWLVGSKPNFWHLAFHLLRTFPHDPALQTALTASAMDMGAMIRGPGSQFYEGRKREVQKLLEDPSTPSEARPWLRDVIESLGLEVKTHLVWEYDREVNDLKRYIHGQDIEQKRWAVGRILKYAEWSDVRKLLSVEDIEEALPYIDLPDRRQTMIKRLLPTWKHAG